VVALLFSHSLHQTLSVFRNVPQYQPLLDVRTTLPATVPPEGCKALRPAQVYTTGAQFVSMHARSSSLSLASTTLIGPSWHTVQLHLSS